MQDKFIVINKKFIPESLKCELDILLEKLAKYHPPHNYLVCNVDETYAAEVKRLILEGEKKK